jgi:type VI secretion system protein ImpF
MAVTARINPTIFDKLIASTEMSGLHKQDDARIDGGITSLDTLRYYSVPKLERFNEQALKATVRRDLAWLLNTTNLGAVIDLEPYPQVETSVLNYGVPDLAGKAISHRVVVQRARDIRGAIRAFEPRIDGKTLMVEPSQHNERENAVTYLIEGDVTASVNALPIKLRTDVEADTASVVVRE